MLERRVAQPAGLQLSSLAQPHNIQISNPQPGHSGAVEPAEHESARPAILFDDQSTVTPDFHAASVDALPGVARPLGLLGAEGHTGAGNSLADAGSGGHRNLAAAIVAPGGIVIPGPGGLSTTVFEAGLGPRPGEPAGSHPGQAGFRSPRKSVRSPLRRPVLDYLVKPARVLREEALRER